MNLKKSLLIAAILFITSVTFWELYWRSQGYIPGLEDDKALWAVQRSKVEKATENDVVLYGSSRLLFDIQLNEFEKSTGIRPIQLATAGASPLPGFHDLVENTNFTGTAIVGVTPGLFFSTTFPMASPWERIQNRVNYYFDRTYAQRINHYLSIPLQNTFAFLTADEEDWNDDLNLKTLLANIQIGNRIKVIPPFYRFQDISIDRNVTMKNKTVQDTAFANTVKKVWQFFGNSAPPPDKESTMNFFVKDAEKFIARGGNLILVRCPSTGYYKEGEAMFLPRAEFWDELVLNTNAKAYHYNDYETLKNFDCPEWSHLSKESAEIFTTELANIMINDGALKIQKNK
jgi:hypothetical protein